MSRNIPLYNAVFLPEMEKVAVEVLRSGKIAGGDWVSKFESEIEKVSGLPNVVSTIDMTTALYLALHLIGVGEGDEVLTTAFACLSTNSAIAQRKATPVWVDVSPASVSMDVADFESKITENTKAVILYHVAGYPGPAREVAEICNKHGITLIEDCDNAMLAMHNFAPVGSFGDFAVYSFYPNRQINTTEGGALACRSAEMANRARKLRRFGIDFGTFRSINGEISSASDVPEIGWSMTLNNMCAALGCAQMASLQTRHDVTQHNVARLRELTQDIVGLNSVPPIEGDISAYWVLLFFVENRDEIIRRLKQSGIMASSIHQRNDIYSGFASVQQYLPNTDFLQNHLIGLPCGWWLNEQDLLDIVASLRVALAETFNTTPDHPS
ncbi:pyridoxal-phosphate-dependent/plp-dependent aminotransferase [Pseudomonas proteolytica]|uniref:DegT/DnrJ/EryC1/StrS family aminotransferase n=1 Tax=Pseudomonas proteolytica TaxID=219574 RepID=UPI001475538B|nr:DegT/DnrJ/EryC1/StrS family aminotransferase [Pseudomonas proteolytica]NMZ01705.1 pyridoxal-phosphate-dependent/plp-dependent aminotransferase [Pseudomonas proteolytica]